MATNMLNIIFKVGTFSTFAQTTASLFSRLYSRTETIPKYMHSHSSVGRTRTGPFVKPTEATASGTKLSTYLLLLPKLENERGT